MQEKLEHRLPSLPVDVGAVSLALKRWFFFPGVLNLKLCFVVLYMKNQGCISVFGGRI